MKKSLFENVTCRYEEKKNWGQNVNAIRKEPFDNR